MAYTATFAASLPQPQRISRNLGRMTGTVTISDYNATLVEITDITKYFSKGIKFVETSGVTSNGYVLVWDYTNKAFKAYMGDYSASVDGPLVVAADSANLGTCVVGIEGIII